MSNSLITNFPELKKGYKSQRLMALYFNPDKMKLLGKVYISFIECKNYVEPLRTLEDHQKYIAKIINLGNTPEVLYPQESFGPLPNYIAYFFNTAYDGSKLVTVCNEGMLRSDFNEAKVARIFDLCRDGTVSPHQAHILSLI